MGEEAQGFPSSLPPPPEAAPPASRDDPSAATPSPRDDPPAPLPPPTPPPPRFDPSRMIGIIRRKALIKDLAAVYHAECLSYCQQLLELQRKMEEPFAEVKHQEEARKEVMRPPKRLKKIR